MSSQETFSITTLQRMCARSEYLDESDIHMNDKTVSWDGNIIYYKTKKPASTGNEFLIPIQVKGKEYNILPDSDSISYPVDINDLKNYLKNGGVIFFVDAISKTEYNDKMYAKILLPVDIVHIMKGKEEQGSITVHLNHVKTVRELEELCVLFKENRPKQAMVGVGKSIPDYDNISNFTISTLPTPYMNPAIAIAKSPFKYVYTKKDGMEIPVLLTDLVTATESEWLIKIDDKIEQRYPVRHIYELNQTTTRISEIIEFVLTEKSQKTTIRCIEATNYNFETVFQASKIIIAVSDAEEVMIENISLGKNFLGEIQTAFTEGFLAYHKRIVQLGETLTELNIKRSLFKTKEILDAEPTIFFLKKGLVEMKVLSLPFQADENCGLYKQIIGRRKLLLEYEKIQEDGYIIRNYLKDGKRIAIFADIPDGKTQKISRWFALRDEDISQMIFDENDLLEEMYNTGEEETDQLLGLILDFLKSYDKERDKNLLLLAEKLINILEKYSMDSTILTINRLQIIARKRELELEERKTLAQIVGMMESAIDKEDVRKEYFLKEKIYEYVMQNIEKALNNLCQDECDTSLENCNRICAAKCGYEKMTEIVDYGQFCKLLNPGKVDEWDNELNLVENLSVDKIQSEIYELLYRSDTPEKVTGDNCGIYLQSKYSQAPRKQVIPTFLDLTRGARKERALQSIFQNIINNTDIIDILAGNSITVIPGSYSGTLSQAQITSGWKNSSPNKVGEYYRDIELISAQELKEKFEQNGGNHD